jgi:hypothetical protein
MLLLLLLLGFILGATLAECINQMPEEAREPAASADRVKDPRASRVVLGRHKTRGCREGVWR